MSRSTVLTVDDNDAGRYAISRVLKLAGFEVKEAASGTEALDMLYTESPHLILLDANLPDASGFEICRRIKHDPRTAAIPVLMTSASFIRDQDRVRGLDEGADAYLTGPLDPDVLIATINAHLRARRAEEELRHSGRQWQTTFDAISDGVALIDRDGKITQCNQALARIFDSVAGELVGRNCSDLLDSAATLPCTEALAKGERDSNDYPLGDRWINISADPVLSDDGALAGVVCIFSDITERKRTEQEIRQAKEAAEAADRAKDQFLAILSHELRTPLTPVLTAVHAVYDEKNLPEEILPYLDVIQRNVELEARLIDDLLDLTRIARDKLQLNIENVDAHTLIRNVLDICKEDIRAKEITVTMELNAPNHHVHADWARLQQVFWNLVKNAVKFTQTGGKITLNSSNPTPDTITMQVIDNGIGIEPHFLPRIFNAFEQGEQSITRRFGGLGLGLAISKALVERHGGELTAMSGGRNKGATFGVTMRSVTPPEPHKKAPDILDGEAVEQGTVRILIVDDHADTSRVMQLLLERRGYHVETASNVRTALDAMTSKEYDLLISDIGLPDGSGLDLIRQIKKVKPIQGVALSGFGMEEDIQNSIEAGFTEHLTKPVSFKQLLDVIQRLTGPEK